MGYNASSGHEYNGMSNILSSLQQDPPPGSRWLLNHGDVLRMRLILPEPMNGQAFVRTNLGHARIAREEIVKAVSSMNAIMNLATGSFGAMLAHEMVASGEVLRLSRQVIRPFYQQKMEKAVELFHEALQGTRYRIHKPEGAMFLWLWFEDLPITSHQLYERLKARNVLVVSGHFFFPGLEPWKHSNECIRVTYSQDEEQVAKGVTIIADEVKKAYS